MRALKLPLSGLTLSIILSGCAGTQEITAQLQSARRERDILRDAYEAQRLRLKELELRLLKLEDREGLSKREVSSHSQISQASTQVPTYENETQSSNQRPSDDSENSWRSNRLRALPVVRVSAAQSLGAPSESDYPRQVSRSRREAPRSVAPRSIAPRSISSRKRTRVLRQKDQQRDQLDSSSSQNLSLTEYNIAHYQERSNKVSSRDDSPLSDDMVRSQSASDSVASDSVASDSVASDSVASNSTSTDQANSQVPSKLPVLPQNVTSITPVTTPSSEENPTSINSSTNELLRRAQSEYQRGNHAIAVRLIKRLITETPTDPLVPDALYLMGRLQIELGEESSGKATLIRLSRLYPDAQAAQQARSFLKRTP